MKIDLGGMANDVNDVSYNPLGREQRGYHLLIRKHEETLKYWKGGGWFTNVLTGCLRDRGTELIMLGAN